MGLFWSWNPPLPSFMTNSQDLGSPFGFRAWAGRPRQRRTKVKSATRSTPRAFLMKELHYFHQCRRCRGFPFQYRKNPLRLSYWLKWRGAKPKRLPFIARGVVNVACRGRLLLLHLGNSTTVWASQGQNQRISERKSRVCVLWQW